MVCSVWLKSPTQVEQHCGWMRSSGWARAGRCLSRWLNCSGVASSCGLGPDPFPSESEGAVGSSRSKAIAPGTKESVALKGDAEEETKKEPASDAEALDNKAAALAFEPDSDEEKKDGSDILHI